MPAPGAAAESVDSYHRWWLANALGMADLSMCTMYGFAVVSADAHSVAKAKAKHANANANSHGHAMQRRRLTTMAAIPCPAHDCETRCDVVHRTGGYLTMGTRHVHVGRGYISYKGCSQ